MSSGILALVLKELQGNPADCERLVELLAPYIQASLPQPDGDQGAWLDSNHAAAYLGISLNSLHKLMADRRIPFVQEGPGCKCYFKRSELDDYRRSSNLTQPKRSQEAWRRLRAVG